MYDRVNKWGGAERVLLVLHEMFPDAPLYTSVHSPEKAPWARVFPKIHTSFLQKWRWAQDHHEWLASLMPLVFESFGFSRFDLVISVTSEAAKGVITGPKTKHICYCLTPTRYLWSGYKEYFGDGILRWVTKPIVSYLRKWDKIASFRPDVIVAISQTVAKRIMDYYGREVKVVYPPLDFHPGGVPLTLLRATIRGVSGEYFLVVSRLVPYKRVDLAIQAFNKLGSTLLIVGTGSEAGRLKGMAKKNICFLGQLTDSELARYYEKASALIFPQKEDFGLAAIEAQSMGTPVIAYKAGGALETVVEGTTGEFFYPQTPESLIKVVQSFDKAKYNPKVLKKHSLKFSKMKFQKALMNIISQAQSVNTPKV